MSLMNRLSFERTMGLKLYERTVRSVSSMAVASDFSRWNQMRQAIERTPTKPLSTDETTDRDTPEPASRKLLKFVNLKNLGTTIRNDSGHYEYYYNPIELGSNPYNWLCVDTENKFSIELILDQPNEKIYLPDLPMRRDDPSSLSRTAPIFESSSTANIPNANNLSHIRDNFSSGVSISGTVRMIVANTERPIIMKSHAIYLKCFIGEYACFVDTNKKSWRDRLNMKRESDEKVIKLLSHPVDGVLDSYLLPFKVIKLDLLPERQMKCLTPGVYEFPFTFTVNLNEFPSSCETILGTTAYRIESRMNISNSRGKNDTIILTRRVDVKRVLSISDIIMKYESINIEGSWNREEFFYNIMLATKMIEIGEPFKLTIGIMKSLHSKMTIENIKVLLAQSTSVPCIDCDTDMLLTTSYVKKNACELYDCQFPNGRRKIENEFHQFYEIDNLLVPELAGTSCSTNAWLRPFYCEPSAQLRKRARLKITHTLNVQLTLNNCSRSDGSGTLKPMTYLTFRIPILLVDNDMLGNLSLPTYRPPCETSSPPAYTLSADPPAYG